MSEMQIVQAKFWPFHFPYSMSCFLKYNCSNNVLSHQQKSLEYIFILFFFFILPNLFPDIFWYYKESFNIDQ